MKVGDLVKLKVGGKDLVVSSIDNEFVFVKYWGSDGNISCSQLPKDCVELSNRRIPDALMLEALQILERFAYMEKIADSEVFDIAKNGAKSVLDKYMKYANIKK